MAPLLVFMIWHENECWTCRRLEDVLELQRKITEEFQVPETVFPTWNDLDAAGVKHQLQSFLSCLSYYPTLRNCAAVKPTAFSSSTEQPAAWSSCVLKPAALSSPTR